MTSGMLWADSSKRPLGDKVKRAVLYFEKKYKGLPLLVQTGKGNDPQTIRLESGAEIKTEPSPYVADGNLLLVTEL